jgi:hypothetical protein
VAVDEVARHGGLVREIVGDVVVAVFGLPRTRDDDAERAVLATLAARDRLATPGAGPPGRACRCWGGGLRGRCCGGAGGQGRRPARGGAGDGGDAAGDPTLGQLRAGAAAGVAGATEPVPVWDALAPRPRSGRAPPLARGAELVGSHAQRKLGDTITRVLEVQRPNGWPGSPTHWSVKGRLRRVEAWSQFPGQSDTQDPVI